MAFGSLRKVMHQPHFLMSIRLRPLVWDQAGEGRSSGMAKEHSSTLGIPIVHVIQIRISINTCTFAVFDEYLTIMSIR